MKYWGDCFSLKEPNIIYYFFNFIPIKEANSTLFWRFETEGGRVADIQLEDALAFFFKALGMLENRAANVVADVGEFGGLLDVFHGNLPA